MKLINRDFELNHYTSMLLNPTPDVTPLDKKNAPIIIDALKMANTIDAIPIDVIDKIKAEIEENINYNKKMNYQGIVAGLLLTLNIIDKYMAESKETINNLKWLKEPINHELFRKALKHRLYERYMDNPAEFKALCGLINDVESVIKHNAECWQEWRVKNEQNIF